MVISMSETQNQKSLIEIAKSENTRLEAEAKEALKEMGYADFLRIPEGATNVQFVDQPPRVNDKFTNRLIFRVSVDGKEYDWSVNTRSPLYRDIMAALAQGHTGLAVLRVGEGMDTRYSVKVL